MVIKRKKQKHQVSGNQRKGAEDGDGEETVASVTKNKPQKNSTKIVQTEC